MSLPVHPPKPRAAPAGGARLPIAVVVATLGGLALLAYHNSFSAPFVFDDIPTILENVSVRKLWPLSEVLAPNQAGGVTTSGRPLVNLSFALNHAFSGYRVGSYHVVNLAIHVSAALCLYGFVRRTLRSPPPRAQFGGAADALALTIAALWLVHPLQTESVTYLVQRAESLVALWYLLTLYCFVRGAECHVLRDTMPSGPIGSSGKCHVIRDTSIGARGWFAASVGACALGMATKEVMATAPLLVLLYDRTFVAGTCAGAWRARRGYYLALTATWVLLALLVRGTGQRGGTAGFDTGVSSWNYALTQCAALVRYVRLSLWPDPLVFDYGLAVVKDLGAVLPQALLILAALAGVLIGLRRRSTWSFGAALFFAVLAPSSSFVPVVTQTSAEHRMYLALAVIVAAVVLGGHALLGRRARYGWVATALALALATAARNHDYRSEAALWADTAAKLPTNARAHNNLGQALFRAGQIDTAVRHYERALQLQPKNPETHYNLGVALARQDRLAAAIEHYETALRLQPHYPEAHNNLGNALVRAGRLPEANRHYEAALAQDRRFAEAHHNLGNALLAADRAAEAVSHFETALRLKPEYPEARYNWGNALAALGRMPEALQQYRQALRLKPDYAEAHVNAGNALLTLEQLAAAVTHYEKALALDPQLAEAANNLGTVYLHTGRVADAVAQFERALATRPDFADARRNLAEARAQLR